MILTELRLALRALRKTPGPAAVAILSVALGIGATTAAFSVAHAVLIDPYPYRDADRIVHLMDLVRARDFADFQKLDVFEDVVATDAYHMTLSEGDLPEAVNSARLSPNAFAFFGVPPLLGRVFTAAGSPDGQEPERVVVLSEAFWRRHYGRDSGVVGRTIDLDRERYTIVGVAPRRLQWRSADVFLPARLSFFSQPSLEVDARLAEGATRERAEADVLQVMRRLYPKMPPTVRFRFRGLSDPMLGNLRSTLVLSLVAVFVLLAIGCANVSILLLARTTARQHELALRAAIGASRMRLVGHLLAESAVLTSIGGACGVLLAFAALDWLVRWLPQRTFQSEADIRVNIPVLMLAAITIATTTVLAGMAPMLRFSRPRLHDLLQGLGRRATASSGTRRVHNLLVASQAALTVALLAAAGTAVAGLLTLYRTAPGFDPRNILRVTVPTVEGAYPTFEALKTFFESVRHEVAALTEVESATYGSFGAPFQGSGQLVDVFGTPRDPRPRVLTQFTTHDFFTTFRIPLLRGRLWTDAENARPANVAVINQALADEFWPGRDAVGQKIRMGGLRSSQFIRAAPSGTDWIEIVGGVGNIRNRGLHNPPAPAAYVPYTLFIGDNQALIVRTRSAPLRAVRAIRERIHAVAAGQPIGPGDNVREGYWTRRFARDPAAIGASIVFGGTPFTIVGVTPKEFSGVDVGKAPDVFVPMMMQAAVMPVTGDLVVSPTTNRLFVQPVGRLKPGVTAAQASAALTTRYRDTEEQRTIAVGRGNAAFVSATMRLVKESSVALAPAATGMSDLRRQFSQPLFILFIVVALVLTVACANTATLMLVRSAARRREFALRAALGASRARLAGQLLVESLMLAGIGGIIGIVLARAAVRGLVAFMSTGRTPIVLNVDPSPRVLAFTAAVSMVTGILFGLMPALRATRVELTPALKQLTPAFRGGRGMRSARVLTVAQISLSLVLLAAAGLFVRSLQNLNAQDAGFDRARVLIVRVEPRGSNQRNPGDMARHLHRTYLDLLERVSAIPGVLSASLGNVSPMKPDPGARILIRRPGDPPGPPPSDAPRASYQTTYPNYFKTLGLSMTAGRDFGAQDMGESSPPVCIINETYARVGFPNADPIGATVPDGGQRRPPCEIVGVARDSRYTTLRGETMPALYVPFLPANTGRGQMILYVRVGGSLGAIVPRLRDAVWNADRTVPQFDIHTLAEEVDGALIQERLIATLSALFAVLALILAAVGLYGLFAFAVVQRTGEIGLRMALGATRGGVVRMVMREAALLVAAGMAIGIPAAFAAARVSSSWIAGLLFGLRPTDPFALAAATIVLGAVAAVAVYLPARRASGVSPIVALRTD